MKMTQKLKSPDVWLGAVVAALLAAALYLVQAITGTAPAPPELVGEFVETLSAEIFSDSDPVDVGEAVAVEGSAEDEGSAEGSGE